MALPSGFDRDLLESMLVPLALETSSSKGFSYYVNNVERIGSDKMVP